MERLTKRSENGTGIYIEPSDEPTKWDRNRFGVLQKLAEYEDLEEQGRLIIFPNSKDDLSLVKVGLYCYKIQLQDGVKDVKDDLDYWQRKQNVKDYEEYINDDLECLKEREEELQAVDNLILKIKELEI